MQEQTTAVARTGVAGVKLALSQPAFAKRFEEILGKRAPQFMASIVSVAGALPQDTEPTSIITSAIIAATLDLPIQKDIGMAFIVPYRNKGVMQAQFQIGWKGFVQLALRSGQYARLNARPINEEALAGFDDIGEPKIDWEKIDSSKPAVGYAVAWRLVNGFTKVCYWSKGRVEAHAKRYSQAYSKGYDTPWKSHFDEMAIKTVVKNELSDWGILSVEMRQASKFDQGVVVDVDSEAVAYPDREQIDDIPRAEATPGPKVAAFKRKAGPVEAAQNSEEDGALGPQSNVVPLEVVKENPPKAAATRATASPAATTPEKSATSDTAASPAEPSTQTTTAAPEVEIPLSMMPDNWLPTLDTADAAGTLKSLMEWLSTEELHPDELMAALGSRAGKAKTVSELRTPQHIGILKAREGFRVAILTARAK